MIRKYRPADDDKEAATEILREMLNFDKDEYVAAKILRSFLNSCIPGALETYTALKNIDENVEVELDDSKIPRLVVDLLDIELLEHRALREILLDKLFEKDKDALRLLEKRKSDISVWNDERAKLALDKLKEESWISGSFRARQFVRVFNFPPIFAGFPSPHRPERTEVIETRTKLPPLTDFQENIKNQVLQMLKNSNSLENRGIVQLPTGAGKTRTTVEAVLEYWKQKDESVQFIIWIAQYNELCEQAVACFRQAWEDHGEEDQVLKLFRVYGGRSLPTADDEGIIIAGIDQLDEFIPAGDIVERKNDLELIKDYVGTVIIDEAHRSIAPTYRKIFRSLGLEMTAKGSKQISLIGLTATPYRTSEAQTEHLLKVYNNNLLYPSSNFNPRTRFDENWRLWDYIVKELTQEQILSVPRFHFLETSSSFTMSQGDTEFLEIRKQFSTRLLTQVGIDRVRNKDVYNGIMKWANEKGSILFFGASVNQAVLMAKLLNEEGIESAVITGTTNYGARLNYVRMFKEKKIKVLCNYEVLTTGFDAPQIDTIIIARPTASRNLYEQMVGRGLRGTKFGGTKECDIITVWDNIYKFDRERVKLGSEEFLSDVKCGIEPHDLERLLSVTSSKIGDHLSGEKDGE